MKTFLQFSGGKDSIACLYLLRERWNDLTVVWANTGAAFPETLEYMETVRVLVPHFLEVRTQQSIAERGYPADLLPTAGTWLGRVLKPGGRFKFQSRWDCCAHAISLPLHAKMKELGAEVLIRGTKSADAFHTPITPGMHYDGITFEFPLWEWTDSQVLAFITENALPLPEHYAGMNTGLDCWNCSAWLDESAGKLAYMRERHPAKFEHLRAVLTELRDLTTTEASALDRALET